MLKNEIRIVGAGGAEKNTLRQILGTLDKPIYHELKSMSPIRVKVRFQNELTCF